MSFRAGFRTQPSPTFSTSAAERAVTLRRWPSISMRASWPSIHQKKCLRRLEKSQRNGSAMHAPPANRCRSEIATFISPTPIKESSPHADADAMITALRWFARCRCVLENCFATRKRERRGLFGQRVVTDRRSDMEILNWINQRVPRVIWNRIAGRL